MNIDAAVTTWLGIKQELRKRMPADEWKLWVSPTRLLSVAPANPLWVARGDRDTLVIALPRSGRAIFKARGREALVRTMCGKAGFNHFFTVAPDDYDVMRLKERFSRTFTFLDPDPVHPASQKAIRAGLAGKKRPYTSSRQSFSGGRHA